MTNGSSQGLFVIVAVVIFGIFVLISYVLFRDNLKVSLASVFNDSIIMTKEVMETKGDNLISGSKRQLYRIDSHEDLGKGEFRVIKSTKRPINGAYPNERSSVMWDVTVPDLKEGDTFVFQFDIKKISHEVTEGSRLTSDGNLRYYVEGVGNYLSKSQYWTLTEGLGEWKTFKTRITVAEGTKNLEKRVRAGIAIGGQETMEFIYRNVEIYRVT